MDAQTPQGERRPAAWSPLFQTEDDGHTPNPIYHSLMRALFSAVDPFNTGVLTPETFASFMDVQEYPLEDNTWKYCLQQTPESHDPLGAADSNLRAVLVNHGCEHRVSTRPGHPNSQVPLVTLAGFTSYFALSHLAHERINAALKHYGVWSELGPLPRDMLPVEIFGAGIDAELFAQKEQDMTKLLTECTDALRDLEYRMDQAQQAAAAESARRQAQQVAEMANMMAAQNIANQLCAQGYRNALAKISGVEYEYEYEYRTQYRQTNSRFDPSSLI
ncbi:hypothetical protein MMYC01_209538 [Madurella mycetomatis]|uniref:DUF7514 domain-containing protein n=1 Tax=Madurella mycetomatis TaxID=100816 RepID=A0A175VS80_9PEZI|nr:hypothetical protein MMYC01_209538 [Madurella mycetomatis]